MAARQRVATTGVSLRATATELPPLRRQTLDTFTRGGEFCPWRASSPVPRCVTTIVLCSAGMFVSSSIRDAPFRDLLRF